MKLLKIIILLFVANTLFAQKKTKDVLSFASNQFEMAFAEIAQSKARNPKVVAPRSIRNDTLFMVPNSDWTSGFFAGNLWYMYELTQDKRWIEKAKEFTHILESQKINNRTHDMGFKMYCSYGNGYRITQNTQYRQILLESARTLTTRYNSQIGSIRSWDFGKWKFPVIIDNMMNLELLFWAFNETKDSLFYNVAVNHALTTMKNHYRADNSSYHVIDYNPTTGEVIGRQTHQGYSDASAWARGQAWGLYGFTMCFRETQKKEFLEHAQKIADFILKHPNLPTDLVPYWDFNAPNIPNVPRDASAASIIASALLELADFVPSKRQYYRKTANKILDNLKKNYLTTPKTHKGFLLTHSTGHLPDKHEVDVPLVYADYYYLEALLRYQKLTSHK